MTPTTKKQDHYVWEHFGTMSSLDSCITQLGDTLTLAIKQAKEKIKDK